LIAAVWLARVGFDMGCGGCSSVISAQESKEGWRWAESQINVMTGGDPITARLMRQDPFTFRPALKLIVY
jgi:phage/plasmid-associated DNA primase